MKENTEESKKEEELVDEYKESKELVLKLKEMRSSVIGYQPQRTNPADKNGLTSNQNLESYTGQSSSTSNQKVSPLGMT